MTVSHELSGVTQAVATISEENATSGRSFTTSPLNSRTFPLPKKSKPLPGLPISKPPYVTCHIECQPRSLPPLLLPPPQRGHPNHSHLPAPPHPRRAKKVPVLHPHLPQLQLTTVNTSYHPTIPGLARHSATPRSTPNSTQTPTKPAGSGRAGTTLTPSHQATCTLTSTPSPSMRKLPPAQVRVARAKAKLGSLLPPNLLQAQRSLLLKKGLPPSQVPNDDFLLLVSPRPLTQTHSQLPLPFLTLPLGFFANQTASSPWVSLPPSTLVALYP